MQRAELTLTDQQIISYIERSWDFEIKAINHINTGSTFAFCIMGQNQDKAFLKIYQKSHDSVQQFNAWLDSYKEIITVSAKLQHYIIPRIPIIICTKQDFYLLETVDYIFVLYEFIEGTHPLNEKYINAAELADNFSRLHHLPIERNSLLPRENFDIAYALGIENLLKSSCNRAYESDLMWQRLVAHNELIKQALHILVTLKKKFTSTELKYVPTHGDGHQYNILQTESKLTLVDWDNIKLAPVERDLWHYMEFSSTIDEYYILNANFVLNHELCLFYKIQRFLEDIRFYLEQSNVSKEQKIENTNDFLNHWGWEIKL